MKIGIDDTPREVKNLWIGINQVPRKVVKAWIGVNGQPRLIYNASLMLNDIEIGEIIYLKEGTEMVPYIKVDNDYYNNGGNVLLRKHCSNQTVRYKENSGTYNNCILDAALKNTFYNTLDTVVQGALLDTDIKIRSIVDNVRTVIDITRKVFTPSTKETHNEGNEGAAQYTYFANGATTRATDASGNYRSYWTRTTGYNSTNATYINSNYGSLNDTAATSYNYYRPALTISGAAQMIQYADGYTLSVLQ